MHKFAQYMAVIDTKKMFFFTFRQTPEIKWRRIIGGTSKPVEELDDETRILFLSPKSQGQNPSLGIQYTSTFDLFMKTTNK
jgi:hypothetical protein